MSLHLNREGGECKFSLRHPYLKCHIDKLSEYDGANLSQEHSHMGLHRNATSTPTSLTFIFPDLDQSLCASE